MLRKINNASLLEHSLSSDHDWGLLSVNRRINDNTSLLFKIIFIDVYSERWYTSYVHSYFRGVHKCRDAFWYLFHASEEMEGKVMHELRIFFLFIACERFINWHFLGIFFLKLQFQWQRSLRGKYSSLLVRWFDSYEGI